MSAMNEAAIPHALRERDQWVLWRRKQRDGKPTKVPYQPDGSLAACNRRATWSSYEDAVAAAGRFDGIGYMFAADDPHTGIDFDDCLDGDGHLHPAVVDAVEHLDTYTEWSPSGTGIHSIAEATKNGHTRCKTGKTPWGGDFEVYDQGRFFTVTGDRLPTAPAVVEPRQAQVKQLLEQLLSPGGAKAANNGSRAVRGISTAPVVEIPVEKMIAEHPSLAEILAGGGKIGDGSPSARDHHLLCQALRLGLDSDEQLTALIRHARRDDSKGRRRDYWKTSIAAARDAQPLGVQDDDLGRALSRLYDLSASDPIVSGEMIGRGDEARVHLVRRSGARMALGPIGDLFDPRKHMKAVTLAARTRFKLTGPTAADAAQMIVQLCGAGEPEDVVEMVATWTGEFIRSAGAEVAVSGMSAPTGTGRWHALAAARQAEDGLPANASPARRACLLVETDDGRRLWLPAGLFRYSLSPGAPTWGKLDALMTEAGWERRRLDEHTPSVPRSHPTSRHLKGVFYLEPKAVGS